MNADVQARRAQKIVRMIEKIEAIMKCRICGEQVRRPMMECTEGGHLFCAECYHSSNSSSPATCPTCGEMVILSNNRVLQQVEELLMSAGTTIQPRGPSNARSLV